MALVCRVDGKSIMHWICAFSLSMFAYIYIYVSPNGRRRHRRRVQVCFVSVSHVQTEWKAQKATAPSHIVSALNHWSFSKPSYFSCYSWVWGLCGGRLPGSHLPVNIQVCASAGWTAGTSDHGEPQKACVSWIFKRLAVECVTRLVSCHRGQSPAEADMNLLETARRCELYGTKMHPAKVSGKWFLVSQQQRLNSVYLMV